MTTPSLTSEAESLEALKVRVEKATDADREIDARILCALAAPKDAHVRKSEFNGEWCIYHGNYKGQDRLWEQRGWFRHGGWPVTASLDAALALVERVLPGFYWDIVFDPRSGVHSQMWKPLAEGEPWRAVTAFHATAPTPALALLSALLSSLIAAEEKE